MLLFNLMGTGHPKDQQMCQLQQSGLKAFSQLRGTPWQLLKSEHVRKSLISKKKRKEDMELY